jgi:hypothetical protein
MTSKLIKSINANDIAAIERPMPFNQLSMPEQDLTPVRIASFIDWLFTPVRRLKRVPVRHK